MSTAMRMKSWLLFLYGLPSQSKTARVNLWRKLKKFGAIQRTSAYVLPDEPAHLERFQWLAKQVRDDGGEASVVQTGKIDGVTDAEMIELFQTERAEDYKELSKEIQSALKTVKKSSPELSAAVEKFHRRFQEIKSIDYFNSTAAHDAEVALVRASSHFNKGSAQNGMVFEKKKFHGKTWLTRPRPEIDRVGSAWLIQRFIDPAAKFMFSPKAVDAPDAIPFDMADAEFTHHGDDCTFETLLKRFGLREKSLAAIGEMIHDADLEDHKFGRIECVGVDLVLKGFGKSGATDDEILSKGFACFDALYTALR